LRKSVSSSSWCWLWSQCLRAESQQLSRNDADEIVARRSEGRQGKDGAVFLDLSVWIHTRWSKKQARRRSWRSAASRSRFRTHGYDLGVSGAVRALQSAPLPERVSPPGTDAALPRHRPGFTIFHDPRS
jgi:hypothetical protein